MLEHSNNKYSKSVRISLLCTLPLFIFGCGGGYDGGEVPVPMFDDSPESSSFIELMIAEFADKVRSETITVMGTNMSVPVSVTVGEYSLNGSDCTEEDGALNAGDVMALQVVAPSVSLVLPM
ncbi:hypothetical protein [Gilvimarinus algae]|uniref:Uncharacterized protein n=1 Tax=Gilvimarinus algae TaxID=3058037 RepID=A0ABT8TB97_9GAMM|nr:hypothetical protein [Gilvimarinus sp. SDUM040014]MDO3380905.1 hypothetical protein [Gilvimarinus sp. SDUM040014]